MYTGSKAVKESGLYTKVIAKAGLAVSDLKETGQKCLKNQILELLKNDFV